MLRRRDDQRAAHRMSQDDQTFHSHADVVPAGLVVFVGEVSVVVQAMVWCDWALVYIVPRDNLPIDHLRVYQLPVTGQEPAPLWSLFLRILRDRRFFDRSIRYNKHRIRVQSDIRCWIKDSQQILFIFLSDVYSLPEVLTDPFSILKVSNTELMLVLYDQVEGQDREGAHGQQKDSPQRRHLPVGDGVCLMHRWVELSGCFGPEAQEMCKTVAETGGGGPDALREVLSIEFQVNRIEQMMKPSLRGVMVGRRGSRGARLGGSRVMRK
jgi:hypothetical protein